ncbi:MAG TPA: hypothetical protein VK574_14825 [Terracidiphilus sp.]|nr:hypothetical protein [Terracidiphilus sp.]
MTAIETLLAGLFDYAGLYPPASLDLRSAANNYLQYRRSKHSAALGRLILSLDRADEFRSIVGDSDADLSLSIIAAENTDCAVLAQYIGSGLRIESLEIKCSEPSAIERIARHLPQNVMAYFEVPIHADSLPALESIRAAGARAKIRMGGVVPEAIPSVPNVAQMLKTLADLRLPFKATAGLHHPLRSKQALTYHPQSPTGVMHGFMNLSASAAVVFFGGDVEEATCLLAEEDPAAWKVSADSLRWRDQFWTADQLATLRRDFFMGIGSCSFEEPIHDLESLGWL